MEYLTSDTILSRLISKIGIADDFLLDFCFVINSDLNTKSDSPSAFDILFERKPKNPI
ncbi:hypothetical protein ACFOUP_12930 [Belliella kenyensis]|uniref:Uncharacterized protein n=1 Tax=Belliella kenyensis TaxID=1472724 RepID=A0ABV8EPL4_9BACT|nr:hypothetical protein [Belliella kenyensis]MCH7400878.1 hypothetical protein [Belliella kenyensis]